MKTSRKLLNGKSILISSMVAISTTILIIYLSGLSSHGTVLENSLISLSILSGVFFLFLTVSLYNGLYVYDDLSRKLKLAWRKPKSSSLSNFEIPDSPITIDTEDGLTGILLSILLWIAMTILFILFLVFMEFILWAGALGFIALVYWILMRALKLIFAKSQECQNDLLKSIRYGVGYTLLYVGWIYGVIYISTLF